ncbi:MAG: hypothetical protein IKB02_09980 [Clostridia bacterium]|nr:hypothetical protein [Clostridia bacterium]MBR2389062.1 hypothetical protein [Clostridia bacterium]
MNEPNFVYKLLDNNKGIILKRNLVVADREIKLSVDNAPSSSLAVFEFDNGRESYKPVPEGECSLTLPATGKGRIKVAIIINNGMVNPRRWLCEGLQYCHTSSGDLIVYPDDSNVPQEITDLKIENEKLREENIKLHKRIDEIDTRLKKIMEGYDLV